jgi:hypothetical protein
VYLYNSSIEGLVVENGKATGFESWEIDKLLRLSKEEQKKFIPKLYSQDFLSLFEKAKEVL